MRKTPHRGRDHDREKKKPAGRWVIGFHAAKEALKVRPNAIGEVWLKQGWESNQELRDLTKGFKPKTVQAGVLDKLGTGHQGLAVQVLEDPVLDWETLKSAASARVIILDGIQDPHNLGAVLRTAWLMGCQALFIPEDRASPLTSTAMKIACGGAEHVPIVKENGFQKSINTLKDLGFWVYGLDAEGPNSLWQMKFPEKVALVIGAEESGIRASVRKLCDEMTFIPQTVESASYNASVATAVALAEVGRQHAQAGGRP